MQKSDLFGERSERYLQFVLKLVAFTKGYVKAASGGSLQKQLEGSISSIFRCKKKLNSLQTEVRKNLFKEMTKLYAVYLICCILKGVMKESMIRGA